MLLRFSFPAKNFFFSSSSSSSPRISPSTGKMLFLVTSDKNNQSLEIENETIVDLLLFSSTDSRCLVRSSMYWGGHFQVFLILRRKFPSSFIKEEIVSLFAIHQILS